MIIDPSQLVSENLEEWKSSAQETLADPRVKRYLEQLGLTDFAKDFLKYIPLLDDGMRDYAVKWFRTAEDHREAGTYGKMLEYFNPDPKGLLVDFGCGAAHLLAEAGLPYSMGVDINHYLLQLGEQVLKRQERKVTRRSRSYISFDPVMGFVLTPFPNMEETCFEGSLLITDDLRDCRNTIRTLYNHGVKADQVVITLQGGAGTYSGIQFLDHIRETQAEKRSELQKKSTLPLYEGMMDRLPKICKDGGRVMLGIRGAKGEAEGDAIDIEKKFGHVIDFKREHFIPLDVDERRHGIEITVVDSFGRKREYLKDKKYGVALIEGRVK